VEVIIADDVINSLWKYVSFMKLFEREGEFYSKALPQIKDIAKSKFNN